MPKGPAVLPYRWAAEFYDDLFAAGRAPAVAARERLLKRVIPQVATACDLACGTGTTAIELARAVIKVYAVDLSPTMCRIARQKAARERVPVKVIQGDMRDFRLPEPVDLVTCEFDAVNHVQRKTDLRRVARAVARALRPGGYFYFDVNNALGFERYWTGLVWVEHPKVVVVFRNGHSARLDRAWADLEWFIKDGNCWRRQRERVEEVCWSGEEIRRYLSEAGFGEIREWDAAPFFKGEPLITRGCRSFYLARKVGGRA